MRPVKTPTCLKQTGKCRSAWSRWRWFEPIAAARSEMVLAAPDAALRPRAACGLRPASAENLAPANTLHAGTETVRSLAANDGGLVGTFHGAAFDGKSLTLERFAYHSVKDHRRWRAVDNSGSSGVQWLRRAPHGARSFSSLAPSSYPCRPPHSGRVASSRFSAS